MKARLSVTNPDSIELTLTVTMDLHTWKLLREQIPATGYPGWKLHSAIGSLCRQAEKHFYEDSSDKDATA